MKMKALFVAVALFSFCSLAAAQEYPIQTIFKGDSVVILTQDQAVDVNDLLREKSLQIGEKNSIIERKDEEIERLKDTVESLQWALTVTKADLGRKLAKQQDTLQSALSSLAIANEKNASCQKEVKRIEKLEWTEKKTRVHMRIGIIGVIATWIALIIASTK